MQYSNRRPRMTASKEAAASVRTVASVSAVTAGRIEALLLPQNWKTVFSWNTECSMLIDDLRALECDPRHIDSSLPDLTQWTGSVRPDWTADGMADRVVLPEGMEFVNPVFAWFCLSLCPHATDDNVAGLFHVLMRCGCDSAKTLGAVTSTGRVVLQFAAAACRAVHDHSEAMSHVAKCALRLLTAHPNLPLFGTAVPTDRDRVVHGGSGPFCCALCTMMFYNLDAAALETLLRLTPAQRLAVLDTPHSAFARFAIPKCPRTFAVLWSMVRDRMTQPDCSAAELDSIIGGPIYSDGYRCGALVSVAVYGDADAWRLVTNVHCPLAAALLRHANAHPQWQYYSPLELSYVMADKTDSERDLRCAWLVPRLCADVLNSYDRRGSTPVMRAAQYTLPRTLAALLDRGVEVDLCAQGMDFKGDDLIVPDALARADTKFIAKTAADLLPADDDEKLMTAQFIPVAVRLRAETKAQMALRPLIAAAVMPALHQHDGAKMPRELVVLCLAYAGLPVPLTGAGCTASAIRTAPAPVADQPAAAAGAAGAGADNLKPSRQITGRKRKLPVPEPSAMPAAAAAAAAGTGAGNVKPSRQRNDRKRKF